MRWQRALRGEPMTGALPKAFGDGVFDGADDWPDVVDAGQPDADRHWVGHLLVNSRLRRRSLGVMRRRSPMRLNVLAIIVIATNVLFAATTFADDCDFVAIGAGND